MAVDAAEPTKVVLVQDDVRLSQMTWLTATTAETAKAAEPAIEVKSKANVWNTRSKSTTLSAPRVTSTKHVVGYRGVLIFISQLALFPTFSIVSSHLDKLGDDPTFTVDPIMKSVAASIGPLGLCLVASLLEKLDKTARESAAAQMANVCGILACTLGLLFDQLPEAVRANPAAVWTGIMFLTGLSDISPFINKARACCTLSPRTSGRNGESKRLIRISGAFYLVFDMFGTGAARLLGGVLRDKGGMQLVLSFALILQVVCGVLLAAYSVWLRRRELVQREEQRRTSASSRFTSLVRQASSSTIKLLSAEHAAEHAAHATAQAITKAAHTVEHAAEHAAHAVAHAVLHPGEAVHELTHKADEAAAKIQALRRGQLERRLTRQSTLTASKKTRDEKLDAKAKVSRMLNGLQVIVFVAGFVAGIMACGAMLRFEEEFQVSNSVTGVCYMLAYALGCCCLLALMKLAHKFALLKPPFDMILSQSLLLVSFALYTIDSFPPAAIGLTGGLAFFIANNGAVGRVLQAYVPKGQEGKVLARIQAMRYAGMCASSFLVTRFGTDSTQAPALLYATLGLLLASVATIVTFTVVRVRAAQKFSAKRWHEIDIFGFESTSSGAFKWAGRASRSASSASFDQAAIDQARKSIDDAAD